MPYGHEIDALKKFADGIFFGPVRPPLSRSDEESSNKEPVPGRSSSQPKSGAVPSFVVPNVAGAEESSSTSLTSEESSLSSSSSSAASEDDETEELLDRANRRLYMQSLEEQVKELRSRVSTLESNARRDRWHLDRAVAEKCELAMKCNDLETRLKNSAGDATELKRLRVRVARLKDSRANDEREFLNEISRLVQNAMRTERTCANRLAERDFEIGRLEERIRRFEEGEEAAAATEADGRDNGSSARGNLAAIITNLESNEKGDVRRPPGEEKSGDADAVRISSSQSMELKAQAAQL